MRVDELFVDPVATADRQLVDVQLARREHHLADRAADLVSVNVDGGKLVIGPDFLNLPQRVLQSAHVPQTDIFERRLIIGRFDCLDPGFRGKRVRLYPVERKCAPCHLYVMRNERTLPHQLVRPHDEATDVPAHHADKDVADEGRSDEMAPTPAMTAPTSSAMHTSSVPVRVT